MGEPDTCLDSRQPMRAVPCWLYLLQHQQHPEDLGHGRQTKRGMCVPLTDSFAGKAHLVKIYARMSKKVEL